MGGWEREAGGDGGEGGTGSESGSTWQWRCDARCARRDGEQGRPDRALFATPFARTDQPDWQRESSHQLPSPPPPLPPPPRQPPADGRTCGGRRRRDRGKGSPRRKGAGTPGSPPPPQRPNPNKVAVTLPARQLLPELPEGEGTAAAQEMRRGAVNGGEDGGGQAGRGGMSRVPAASITYRLPPSPAPPGLAPSRGAPAAAHAQTAAAAAAASSGGSSRKAAGQVRVCSVRAEARAPCRTPRRLKAVRQAGPARAPGLGGITTRRIPQVCSSG